MREYFGTKLTIPRNPKEASAKPATLARPASTRLSTNSCRISLHRPAPKAARIAISPCLAAPRARSMLATLAQTIISTNTTAPNSARRASRSGPSIPWILSGSTEALQPALVFGYCIDRRLATVPISAWACFRVEPDLRRAMTWSRWCS